MSCRATDEKVLIRRSKVAQILEDLQARVRALEGTAAQKPAARARPRSAAAAPKQKRAPAAPAGPGRRRPGSASARLDARTGARPWNKDRGGVVVFLG